MLEPAFRFKKSSAYKYINMVPDASTSQPNVTDDWREKKRLFKSSNTTPIDFEYLIRKFIEYMSSLDTLTSHNEFAGRFALRELVKDYNRGRSMTNQCMVLDSEEDSSSLDSEGDISDSSDEELVEPPVKKNKADTQNFVRDHQLFVKAIERRLRLYILNDTTVPVRLIANNQRPSQEPPMSLSDKKKYLKNIVRRFGCRSQIYKDWVRPLERTAQAEHV